MAEASQWMASRDLGYAVRVGGCALDLCLVLFSCYVFVFVNGVLIIKGRGGFNTSLVFVMSPTRLH